MSEVLRACAVFFLYAAAAMFAENAVFSRALGVSRLVKLVDDSTVDTLVFGGLMCAVQLISAPLAKVANSLIQPFEFRSAIRPLVFILCSAVAFAVVPVQDSDTGSWSFGVLKNPGQYCAVLGFGLLGLLLYRYLCQQAPIAPICFKNGSVLTQYGRLDQLNPTQYNVFYDLSHWTVP